MNEHTTRLERTVDELISKPLMRENVFHSAKFTGGGSEKEVCDVLLVHRREALVLSIKGQDAKRNAAKTDLWLKKAAGEAASQLRGAYRTLKEREFWCQHPTHGRKRFRRGDVLPCHSIALLETDHESVVEVEPEEFSRLAGKAPLTLMSVSDFALLVRYLRTFRDLKAYLDSRTAVLRDPDRRVVGAERSLFCFYTAHRDSFFTCTGVADAKLVTAHAKHLIEGSAYRDRELGLASILEDFMEQIGHAGSSDLPAEMAMALPPETAVEDATARDTLRDDLCDLTIQDRAGLGEQIGHLCGKTAEQKESNPLMYGAVHLTHHPDTVFMIVAGWERDPHDACGDAVDVTLAACAYYGRSTGIFLLLNQQGPAIRYSFGRFPGVQATEEYLAAGREYFEGVQPRRVEIVRNGRASP